MVCSIVSTEENCRFSKTHTILDCAILLGLLNF